MLKKVLKSVFTAMLCAAVVLSVSTGAFAAGRRAVSITMDGQKLDVGPVLLQDGRTYVPYDKLFGALGAAAVHDEATGTVTAESGDTVIVLAPDDYYIEVTAGDTTQWVYTGAPTILDTSGGTVFVPLRYTAQALGYVTGWDEETRSIELMSVDALIDASGATYTVMDRYLEYISQFGEKCHRVDGSFQAEINLDYILGLFSDNTIGPLTVSGTVSGLVDPGGEDMSLYMKTNLSDALSSLEALLGEAPDEEVQAFLAQLDEVDISLITNHEDGVVYIKSPLLSALMNISEDAWLSVETGEALSLSDLYTVSDTPALSILNAGQLSAGGEGFRQYVEQTLKSVLLEDSGNETALMLEELNSLFSDQAMARDGDDYVVTLTDSTQDDYGYEETLTVDLRLAFDADEFSGINVDYTTATVYSYWEDYEYTSSTELSYSFNSDGRSALTLASAEDGTTVLSFDMAFEFTETDETPAREPEAGSTVVSLDDIGTFDLVEEEPIELY